MKIINYLINSIINKFYLNYSDFLCNFVIIKQNNIISRVSQVSKFIFSIFLFTSNYNTRVQLLATSFLKQL